MSKQKLRPFKSNDEIWEMARFKSVYVLGKENRSEYIRRRIESDEDYKDTEYNINLRKAAPELLNALQRAKSNIEKAHELLESKKVYCSKGVFEVINKAIQKALGNDN